MQVSSTPTQMVNNSYQQNARKDFEKISENQDYSLNTRTITMLLSSGENVTPNALAQSSLFSMMDDNSEMKDFLSGIESEGAFSLSDMGYEGKAISKLNSEEASALVAKGGFFSVETTAERTSDFVIDKSGDDLAMLKAGREGIVKGFADAEKMWGGKLPDMAYETQQLTLEKIDARIQSLGGHALDVAV